MGETGLGLQVQIRRAACSYFGMWGRGKRSRHRQIALACRHFYLLGAEVAGRPQKSGN